jgi:hypothetical protein
MSPYLIAGILAGMAGLITFLVIHHFWIRPIWAIFPAGLAGAVIGGVAVGWSYAEIRSALPDRPWTALAIMGIIALVLAPSVLLAQSRAPLLDPASFSIPAGKGAYAATRFVLELVLTSLLVGAAIGWLLGHTPRATLATALAGLAFGLGPGHNVPLLGNTPAAGKGLVLLAAITAVSAVVLVESSAWLARR